MKISELARISGVRPQTIRYYERAGVLAMPTRTAGDYRDYADVHAQRLAFIRHCRALGLPLREIGVLLGFKDSPGKPCEGVTALPDEQIEATSRRISELQRLRAELQLLPGRCARGRTARSCGILGSIEKAAGRAPATRARGLAA